MTTGSRASCAVCGHRGTLFRNTPRGVPTEWVCAVHRTYRPESLPKPPAPAPQNDTLDKPKPE